MDNLLLVVNFGKTHNFLIFAMVAVLATVLMVFVGYKFLQILQLANYKMRGYFKWFKETKFSYFSRLFMLSFLCVSSMLITNVLLKDFFIDELLSYISILFFILFSSVFITNLFTVKQKTPLKYTKRMTRLLVVFVLLVAGTTWALQLIGFLFVPYLSFGLIAFTPILLPLLVVIAYYITYPLEKLISNSYLKRAKQKLQSNSKIKVIGITGSYGKTSLKNILGIILKEKFKVCATPASYNTPLGISKTILSNLKDDDEVFIAEMGAKQRFDIDELCKLTNPSVGIITGIGNQHFLTFGSIDNVIKTKSELAEYITKNNGQLFFNADNKVAMELSQKYKKSIYTSILETEKVKDIIYVSNIKTTKSGSTFTLEVNGESQKCQTILLGEHNVSNILLASNVAYQMGLNLKEIASGISKLTTIPHRLEILKSSSTYTIIDDAYNCSVEGSKASINVLSKFDGKKFVITPGLVELGKEQFNCNFEFGRDMANVCDYVIIDSTINFEAISSGLIFAGFNEKNIIQTANLSQAVEVLTKLASKDDIVLFENDLPDNYS